MQMSTKALKLGVIALAVIIVVAGYFYLTNNINLGLEGLELNELTLQYGLIGLFIAAIIANASIVLPLPIDLVVIAVANLYNPFVLAAVVSVGAAIGEMSAYLVGMGGEKAIRKLSEENAEKLMQVNEFIRNKGMVFIALGSFTPFPFDLIGIASGLIRYNIYKFFVAALVGKFFRYLVLAYAIVLGLGFLQSFFMH
jgi:membrane protein YqaA with SNARE-associated domain